MLILHVSNKRSGFYGSPVRASTESVELDRPRTRIRIQERLAAIKF
jgi:hypothetical protein